MVVELQEKGGSVQNGESKKLPPLPSSNHKWWGEARKHRIELREVIKCKHYFIYKKNGREIGCKHCPIGYFASPKIRIEKGKLVV